MNCWVCKGHTKIIETRVRSSDGLKRRRYECGKGHRFTTLEMVVAVDQGPLEVGTPYRGSQRAGEASRGAA